VVVSAEASGFTWSGSSRSVSASSDRFSGSASQGVKTLASCGQTSRKGTETRRPRAGIRGMLPHREDLYHPVVEVVDILMRCPYRRRPSRISSVPCGPSVGDIGTLRIVNGLWGSWLRNYPSRGAAEERWRCASDAARRSPSRTISTELATLIGDDI
jgi:hypothetical protein